MTTIQRANSFALPDLTEDPDAPETGFLDFYIKDGVAHLINESDVATPIGTSTPTIIGQEFTPPPLSGWTWVNQGSATLDTSRNRLELYNPGSSGTNNMRLLVRSLPSPPYNVAAFASADVPPISSNIGRVGLCARESGSGKFSVLTPYHNVDYGLNVMRQNSPTSHSSTPYNSAIPNIPALFTLRISDDGAGTLSYYFGSTIYNLQPVWTESTTVFGTWDQYGFMIEARDNAAVDAALTIHSVEVF